LHPINIGNIINALDIFIWNVELHGRGVDGGGYMCIVESWDCFDEVVSGKNVIFFFLTVSGKKMFLKIKSIRGSFMCFP